MRSIVVAVGNPYRRDDGVGRHIVAALRQSLGLSPLGPFDDGYDDLGRMVDTIVLHQMVPEVADTVKDYDRAVFVDAHVPRLGDAVREEQLKPEFEATHLVSHQFKPGSILALAQQLYGRAPKGLLLSLPGYDFDFGEELSPQVAAMLPQIVARILEWTQAAPLEED